MANPVTLIWVVQDKQSKICGAFLMERWANNFSKSIEGSKVVMTTFTACATNTEPRFTPNFKE